MKGRAVSIPSPDPESIVRRYVPTESCAWCSAADDCTARAKIEEMGKKRCPRFRWGVGLAEFESSGQEIIAAVDAYGIALGGLLQWGWDTIKGGVLDDGQPIRNKTHWMDYCSRLWTKNGCRASLSTLKKAWGLVGVEIPDDMSNTLAYEVGAGLRPGEDRQKALATVSHMGYNAYHVRVLKGLRKRFPGLVKGWVMPDLRVEEGVLTARLGKKRCVVAKIEEDGNPDLAAAALYMLSKGIGVEIIESEEEKDE